MRVISLVLAGGRGLRFWPRSTAVRPKQFFRLDGETSLLQATVQRLGRLVPPRDVYVVTGEDHEALVRAELPELPAANVISEPLGRDTAAAIGFSLTLLGEAERDSIAVVVPADHYVTDEAAWATSVADACRLAAAGGPSVVLVGVRPTRPETAYGYIVLGADYPGGSASATRFFRVERFIEKPEMLAALRLLDESRCLWNSGMFIWKVGTALDLIAQHLPDMHAILGEIARLAAPPSEIVAGSPEWRARVVSLYAGLRPISIDYGVIEKADGVVVGLGEFGWDDVGSWEALARLLPADERGNIVRGDVMLEDSAGCIVDWAGGPALVVGLRNAVIAGGAGPLLACSRDQLGRLKNLLSSERFRQARRQVHDDGERAGHGGGAAIGGATATGAAAGGEPAHVKEGKNT